MKRALVIGCVCMCASLVAATPGIAANDNAPNPRSVAAKACHDEKQADKAAFRALYGKHAMRECIRSKAPKAEKAIKNAAQECKAERAADPDAFKATYGDNANGKNAFGNCVSQKVDEDVDEDTEEFANAAKDCRDERSADPDAFRETYGKNKNGKNAFGKCVSTKTHA